VYLSCVCIYIYTYVRRSSNDLIICNVISFTCTHVEEVQPLLQGHRCQKCQSSNDLSICNTRVCAHARAQVWRKRDLCHRGNGCRQKCLSSNDVGICNMCVCTCACTGVEEVRPLLQGQRLSSIVLGLIKPKYRLRVNVRLQREYVADEVRV